MSLELERIQSEIAAFADDDNDVIVEGSGNVLFSRGGREVSCKLSQADTGDYVVEVDAERLTYRRFLSHYLGRLDVLAEKLLEKRSQETPFIDGPAHVDSISSESRNGKALDLLHQECTDSPPFSARVVFVTADAGQGKTILLRQYQAQQAARFRKGKSSFVFWHVDLQGRQLLRLHEALMGDLGELRVAGIFVASLVVLLRQRLLVIAIDGFDELSAEQGSADALGALAQLVRQLQDQGTIVAASRRTFFDTEDYLKRARILRSQIADQSEFDQIHLKDWAQPEVGEYFRKVTYEDRMFPEPDCIYQKLLQELDDDPNHPMLTRPFLVAHAAKALLLYDIPPTDFIGGMNDPMQGVASVVQAFVKREVSQKWITRDGEPYLTVEQHMRLLASVAEEMWRLQQDRLPIDVIETLAVLLLDEWGIPEDRKRQVIDMVKMHVLLPRPNEGDPSFRAFDHAEFQNYFVAFSLAELLRGSGDGITSESLGRFLAVAQLPESTAKYAAALVKEKRSPALRAVPVLVQLADKEWRPTFLHVNVGTILPYLLHDERPERPLRVEGKITYSGLAFENTALRDVTFRHGQFVNSSFTHVDWTNIMFVNCQLDQVTIDRHGRYENVVFEDCQVSGLTLLEEDEEASREYSPVRIAQTLSEVGIRVIENAQSVQPTPRKPPTVRRKLVEKVLRHFRRTTAMNDNTLRLKFGQDASRVIEDLIPLMTQYQVISLAKWRGRGAQNRWVLTRSVEEIERADGTDDGTDLAKFWQRVDVPE